MLKLPVVLQVDEYIGHAAKLLQQGAVDSALSVLSPFIENELLAKDLHYIVALCHISKGNLETAKTALQRELAKFPGNTPAKEMLESVLLDLGYTNSSSEKQLSFLQLHTYYDHYLEAFYQENPSLLEAPFDEQMKSLIADGFAAIHMFSPWMGKFNYLSHLIIANCAPAQVRWCQEHGIRLQTPADWKYEIAQHQIDYYKPDVLYLGDSVDGFDAHFLAKLKHKPKLVIGWRAATIPDGTDWRGFDIILSGLSALRKAALGYGAKEAIDFYPGYPCQINKQLQNTEPQYDISFSGQWTLNQHPMRNYYLARIAEEAEKGRFTAAFYLSGQTMQLPDAVAKLQKGARYGVAMHKALTSGRIAFDARGIIGSGHYDKIGQDLAGNETTNMRLFEATGAGAFVLTEYRDNLSKYFEIDQEIVTFKDEQELFEKIEYYLHNPEQRIAIAKRGQQRCLKEHSMEKRAGLLNQIIRERLASVM